MLLSVGGGLLLGVLGGIFVIAPRLSHSSGARGGPVAAETVAAGQSQREHVVADGKPRPIYTIDNLVLNPAQSGGTRFLMLAVAFELSGADREAAMKARESEVRDTVLRILGEKTVAQLSEVSQRDTLKAQLQAAVGSKLGAGSVTQVFFPQFVIQ